jgi:hypothetical protein
VTDAPEDNTPSRRVIDDPDLDNGLPLDANALRRATEFMSTTRETQRHCGRTLSGRTRLSDETLDVSAQARQSSSLLDQLARPPAPVVPSAVQQKVFEAFEEMCRRRKVVLLSDLRPAVYRLLGIELAINSQILEDSPEHLAPATVYNGSMDQLQELYPEFRDAPYIFRLAAISYPSDPAGFLQDVREAIARLEQDERFTAFRKAPGIFREAAIKNLPDPESALLRLQATVSRLEQDERFAAFRDTPGVFRHVAHKNASDPEGALLRLQAILSRLEQDERFAAFRDTPGVFREAAIKYPSDPEGFLLGVQHAVSRLEQDERFAAFRASPSVFRLAALKNPSDPEGFLLGVQQTVSRLEQDERFAEFRDAPGVFREAAIDYSDPEGFLLGVQQTVFVSVR